MMREFGRIGEGDELQLFRTTAFAGQATEEPLTVMVDGVQKDTLRGDEINRADIGSHILHPKLFKHEIGWQEDVPQDMSTGRRR